VAILWPLLLLLLLLLLPVVFNGKSKRKQNQVSSLNHKHNEFLFIVFISRKADENIHRNSVNNSTCGLCAAAAAEKVHAHTRWMDNIISKKGSIKRRLLVNIKEEAEKVLKISREWEVSE